MPAAKEAPTAQDNIINPLLDFEPSREASYEYMVECAKLVGVETVQVGPQWGVRSEVAKVHGVCRPTRFARASRELTCKCGLKRVKNELFTHKRFEGAGANIRTAREQGDNITTAVSRMNELYEGVRLPRDTLKEDTNAMNAPAVQVNPFIVGIGAFQKSNPKESELECGIVK